jgi:hypothetical protein
MMSAKVGDTSRARRFEARAITSQAIYKLWRKP